MAFFTRMGHAVPEVPHGGEYDGVMVADLMVGSTAAVPGPVLLPSPQHHHQPVLGSVCAAGKMTTHVHPHVTVTVPAALNPRNYPLVRQGPPPHYPISYSSIDEEDDQVVVTSAGGVGGRAVDV